MRSEPAKRGIMIIAVSAAGVNYSGTAEFGDCVIFRGMADEKANPEPEVRISRAKLVALVEATMDRGLDTRTRPSGSTGEFD